VLVKRRERRVKGASNTHLEHKCEAGLYHALANTVRGMVFFVWVKEHIPVRSRQG
jgi:hypothetical protein